MSGVYLGVDGRLAHSQDVTLLAFTGRQDVKGRPVFEMDVVDFDMIIPMDEKGEFTTAQRARGIVKWIDPPGWYGFECNGKKPEDEYTEWEAQNALVVGNALVTPKLLELPPRYEAEIHTLEGQSKPPQV